jgi:hypothetical protein
VTALKTHFNLREESKRMKSGPESAKSSAQPATSLMGDAVNPYVYNLLGAMA